MDLVIKSDEAERLAHELAERTGETVEEAVTKALRARLERADTPEQPRSAEEIAARISTMKGISRRWRENPLTDRRDPDAILYDADGLPKARDDAARG